MPIERGTLFLRLVATQVACGMALLLALGGVRVWETLRPEVGRLDQDLRFHARVASAPLDEPDTLAAFPTADLRNVEDLLEEAAGFDGRRIAFQALDPEGRLLHRSAHAPTSPWPVLPPGFHDLEVAGVPWRVFVMVADVSDLLVVAGERVDDRTSRTRSIAADVGGPLVLILPALLVGGWFASRYAMRPLRQVVARLASRPAGDTTPVPAVRGIAELAPLVHELNTLLARMHDARLVERHFFADAAHELKTPLAVVATQAHLLATAASDPDRVTALADLEQALQRASHLVSQLLSLAAAESRAGSDPADVDLADLLAERLAVLSPLADARRVELSLDAPSPVVVSAAPDDLVSLFDNLIDNAIRYNRPGGLVDATLARTGDTVTVTITDTGPGIPPADRARVFERFYRGPGVTAAGSGLGLPIVRAVAGRLGGVVRLGERTDAPGGLIVTVVLPVRR